MARRELPGAWVLPARLEKCEDPTVRRNKGVGGSLEGFAGFGFTVVLRVGLGFRVGLDLIRAAFTSSCVQTNKLADFSIRLPPEVHGYRSIVPNLGLKSNLGSIST